MLKLQKQISYHLNSLHSGGRPSFQLHNVILHVPSQGKSKDQVFGGFGVLELSIKTRPLRLQYRPHSTQLCGQEDSMTKRPKTPFR